MSENVGALTSRNPTGLHGLYRDNLTLPYILQRKATTSKTKNRYVSLYRIILLYQCENEVIKQFTFSVNPNPIEIPGEFLGNICLASGWEANHSNDMRTVDIVRSFACTNIKIS
jgi:hypothetical protein